MRKYINALLYGNAKTKRILLTAILLAILTIVCVVLAATGNGIIWALFAAFSGILELVLLQSVRFGEIRQLEAKGKPKTRGDEVSFQVEKLSDISEDMLKKLLVAYKVKADHVPVLIDRYEEEGCRQVPAYMWVHKGFLHFFVLENTPRQFAVPLSEVTHISYVPQIPARPSTEYADLQVPSFMNMVFGPLLPTYQDRMKEGRRVHTKNIYRIEPGIEITNHSVKNAGKILNVPITFERVFRGQMSESYKQAYEKKILLVDSILTPEEYKKEIAVILKTMADEVESFREFTDDIEKMVSARLITREIADYYTDYRQKKNMKTL